MRKYRLSFENKTEEMLFECEDNQILVYYDLPIGFSPDEAKRLHEAFQQYAEKFNGYVVTAFKGKLERIN